MIARCVSSWSPRGKCGLGNERKEQVMCCSKDRKGGKGAKGLGVNRRWRGEIWKENVFISGIKSMFEMQVLVGEAAMGSVRIEGEERLEPSVKVLCYGSMAGEAQMKYDRREGG